jgi:AraC-like DNA-binding protein
MDTFFAIWPISPASSQQWLLGGPDLHRHAFHQVVFLTEGGGSHRVDGQERKVQAPWLMVIPKGKMHLYLPDQEARGWIMDFGEEFLEKEASELLSLGVSLSDLAIDEAELFEQSSSLARIIWDLGKVKRDEARPALRHLLSAFLLLFQPRFREQAGRSQPHRASDFQLAQAFLRLLDASFSTEKEVEFYVRKLRCTPRRLGAACKAALGRNPQTVIIERCMLEAKRFLLHTEMTIQQIATTLGCEDQSNFTKAFRKATGETPSGFRKARTNLSATAVI